MSRTARRAVVVALLAPLGLGACGTSAPGPPTAAQEAYLGQIHNGAPDVNQYRSDTQLLRLGAAACAGFESGESFEALADRMADSVGPLPTAELGTLIAAAADNLCPSQRAKVD